MNECREAFVVLYFTYNFISRSTFYCLCSTFYISEFPSFNVAMRLFTWREKVVVSLFAAIKREIYVPLFTFYPFSRSGGSATIGFDDSNYRKL